MFSLCGDGAALLVLVDQLSIYNSLLSWSLLESAPGVYGHRTLDDIIESLKEEFQA